MKSALLVIDVQQGLFGHKPQPYRAALVIANINRYIGQARHNAYPVIFTQAEHPQALPYGSAAWQLHTDLHIMPDDIIMRKTQANAFLGTGLESQLKSLGILNLIICGYATEFCIDSTLRYASALGYTIDLAADGHTTHDKAHLEAKKIIEHHNITLSMAPNVTALKQWDIFL